MSRYAGGAARRGAEIEPLKLRWLDWYAAGRHVQTNARLAWAKGIYPYSQCHQDASSSAQPNDAMPLANRDFALACCSFVARRYHLTITHALLGWCGACRRSRNSCCAIRRAVHACEFGFRPLWRHHQQHSAGTRASCSAGVSYRRLSDQKCARRRRARCADASAAGADAWRSERRRLRGDALWQPTSWQISCAATCAPTAARHAEP